MTDKWYSLLCNPAVDINFRFVQFSLLPAYAHCTASDSTHLPATSVNQSHSQHAQFVHHITVSVIRFAFDSSYVLLSPKDWLTFAYACVCPYSWPYFLRVRITR